MIASTVTLAVSVVASAYADVYYAHATDRPDDWGLKSAGCGLHKLAALGQLGEQLASTPAAFCCEFVNSQLAPGRGFSFIC